MSVRLFDTHCHIQESFKDNDPNDLTHAKWAKLGNLTPEELVARAQEVGVSQMICVGCALDDSERAIAVARANPQAVRASIGIHPHEAAKHLADPGCLTTFAALAAQPEVVAVGECGLDYYYENSPREAQAKILRFQIELALQYDLPMIFHVRDAFADFWPIFDEYEGIRGVIHSFTATEKELAQALERGLYIGLNGIMTFTKDQAQLAAAKAIPLERMVLETDAPYLTPASQRGTICEPKHVRETAEFLASLRGETLEVLSKGTTQNAQMLFDF
jgi:TatD DNase family protein